MVNFSGQVEELTAVADEIEKEPHHTSWALMLHDVATILFHIPFHFFFKL